MVVGLPVLLGLIWWSGESRQPTAAADVTIDTSKVVELRGLVISRLGAVGAVKTVENTAYTDGGESDLTFRVPPERLEEALVELNLVGGVVTRQRVELDDLSKDADDISTGLGNVEACLADLAARLDERNATGATTGVAECREQLDVTGRQIDSNPTGAEDAVLNVHITRTSTTSPALVVAVILLAIALATMAYLTIRSTRGDRVYDITDRRPAKPEADLYHRRN